MYSKSILVPRSCQENILLCLLWLGFPLLTMVSFLWYRKQQWMEVGCKCNVTSEPECRTIQNSKYKTDSSLDLNWESWLGNRPGNTILNVYLSKKVVVDCWRFRWKCEKSCVVWWKNHATTPTKHFEWNYCSQDQNIPLQLMFSFHPLIDSMPTIFGIFGIRIVSS